jgi:hypothetical protein
MHRHGALRQQRLTGAGPLLRLIAKKGYVANRLSQWLFALATIVAFSV